MLQQTNFLLFSMLTLIESISKLYFYKKAETSHSNMEQPPLRNALGPLSKPLIYIQQNPPEQFFTVLVDCSIL